MVTYNPWPIGKVPKELQRPELEDVKEFVVYNDPRELVTTFEEEVALFAGSRYAVAVDCCTHAIELCLRMKMELGELKKGDVVNIPAQTYVSVPMTIQKVGLEYEFRERPWFGYYSLICSGTTVVDAAVTWQRGMYTPGTLHCISFQIKKAIPIGRGGMILTDNPVFANILKLMSYDGRDLNTPYDSENHVKRIGYHYYMTPEDAARGLILMNKIDKQGNFGGHENYPNLKQWLKH